MMRRGVEGFVLLAAGCLLAACAVRQPVVTDPAYPTYPTPIVPANLHGTEVAAAHGRAWTLLQAGDIQQAEEEFRSILVSDPDFHPSHAGLGFVLLASSRFDASIEQFDQALLLGPEYLPALLGRAEVFLAVERVEEAVKDLSAALVADPTLTTIRRRIAELEFTALMSQVALARQAAEAGRYGQARDAYERVIALSPDSAFLYVELARLESHQEDHSKALQRLEQAVLLDPGALEAWILMADLYLEEGDLDLAEQALFRADAIEFVPEVPAGLAEIEARRQAASLPAAYSDIESAAELKRGQLAALVGVRFESILNSVEVVPVAIITDARGHWGYQWIIDVVQAGLMETDVNYRFQPDIVVTRAAMAGVLVRILRLVEAAPPSMPQPIFADLAEGHLAYPAAAEAVSAGLLVPGVGGFQPNDAISGEEAIEALVRLAVIAEIW